MLRLIGIFAFMVLATPALAEWPAGQPMLPIWKPASGDNALSTYEMNRDPDALFARGNVALAERVPVDPRLKANPNARTDEARVMVLATSGYSASDTAAHSLGTAAAYGFSFWQYIDSYVFWGGSAGEGNILTPHPGVIDAAHRNGVPVYGTIFFPPNEFGGEMSRVDEMLAKAPDGSFPIADKLIEVMRANGFDGYFINQETVGGDATTAQLMQDLMRYFQAEAGLGKELIWYDAMTETGVVRWQEQLNDKNDAFFQADDQVIAEKMFLDFGWRADDLRTTRDNARALGRSEFDLYAAVNVEGAGYNQRVNWPALFPKDKAHTTSLALFVPTWTWNHSKGSTPEARVANYRKRESRLWVGANGNPLSTSEAIGRGNWRGVSHFIPARTAVVGDQFVTSFNLGHGFAYYLDGKRVSSSAWSNLSLQDLLPTWRWIVQSESKNPLTASLDFEDAYHGGTSLRVRGNLEATTDLRLYASRLKVHDDSQLNLATKIGSSDTPTHAQVLLAFSDDPTHFAATLDVGNSQSEGWDVIDFDLSAHAGKTISQIGLRFLDTDQSNYDIRFGQIALTRGKAPSPATPANLRLLASNTDGQAKGGLRLAWEAASDSVDRYHVFQRHPNGKRTFLEGTTGGVAFVRRELLRETGDTLTIEVEALNERLMASEPRQLTIPADYN